MEIPTPADIENEEEKVEAEIRYLNQRYLCVHEKIMERREDLERIRSGMVENNDPTENREESDRLYAELGSLYKDHREISNLLLQKIKEKKELLFPEC